MSSINSFGEWIRRRRKSLDLTQAGLANRVGCALITIKKIEQDERRPSRLMASRLAESLEVPETQRAAFIQAALSQLSPERLPPPAAETPPTWRPTRLPQPATPLIGRKREIAEGVRQLLRHTRLLTLTGTGGVGKTRLALAIAQEIAAELRNGAVFVSLAAVQIADEVPARISKELGLKESSSQSIQDTLLNYLSNQEILLLLDNFEHLLPAAPLVAEMIQVAPGLRILVTSRSLLHLSGETVMSLQPLALPEPRSSLSDDQYFRKITRSDAVRLFISRATARWPAFHIDKENGRMVADICRRLDGLPLAIELAAARVREYPLALLQQELSQRLNLVSDGYHDLPDRQRTLRNTFDWSFSHLGLIEKVVFPRLGVFSGGFTFEAAQAVCSDYSRDELLIAIGGLVDKNMIFKTEEGDRYNLLETTHGYAVERLMISRENQNARRNHLVYYRNVVETAEPHLWDKEQREWLSRLSLEIDNLRAALRWSLERATADESEVDLGAKMAAALWYFWYLHGILKEGAKWLEIALERVTLNNLTQAKLLMASGTLAWQQGKLQQAAKLLQESLNLYGLLEDRQGLAEATHMYGHVIFDQQLYEEAEANFRDSLSIYESLGDRTFPVMLMGDLGMVACHQGDLRLAREYYEKTLALCLQNGIRDSEAQSYIRLGDVARLDGDYHRADDLYKRSLVINRELKIHLEIACSLHKLGFTALQRSEVQQAKKLFCESLALQNEFGNQQGIAECLAGLASVYVHNGEDEHAARCFGAAQQILTNTGLPMAPADLVEWQRDEALARSRCEPGLFEQAWSKGEEESIESLIASLLGKVL